MKPIIHLLFLLILPFFVFSQKTKIYGTVKDGASGESVPFVRISFHNSKIGATSDSIGNYSIETYYASDSIQFSSFGYKTSTYLIKIDESQEINAELIYLVQQTDEVTIHPPDELPSTILHKRLIANKKINDKEKLSAYEYELYNKIELDVNNVNEVIKENGLLKKIDFVMNYLDSTSDGKNYLPLILSESISDFYHLNQPKRTKEIITASKISGVENLQLEPFLGDMYLDINMYNNYINMFRKAFISPAANFARTFYKFYLEDSTFIDSKWCYKLRFTPKRTGDLTFEGEMWITDSTYAIKKISGSISPGANLNYIQDLHFVNEYNLVAPEVWMLTYEEIIAEINITQNSKLYGLYGRKHTYRKNFKINEARPIDFYKSSSNVEIHPDAKNRDLEYWKKNRHLELTKQEKGINEMVDSLNNVTAFKTFKKLTYCLATGYYPINNFEIGDIANLFSFNPIEKQRYCLDLRTSKKFSRRIEIGGRIAYGVGDDKFKFGFTFRSNFTPKKRGLLSTYYTHDIQQIGQSQSASSPGSTFGTLLRTGPLDKLTFVKKAGCSFEKDIQKDLILFGGFDWKEYTSLGKANYLKWNENSVVNDTIRKIYSSEFIARIRWAKNEEFIAGPFDRTSISSRYPVLSLQGTFGVKGLLGGEYNYQKIEFQLDHKRQIGVFGNIRYGLNAGYVFGSAAYPFLKVHEGSQSYWLMTNAFNKLNFFEFISDKYVGGYIEEHFGGLIFNRIPLVKKLKWRIVSSYRITYGDISAKNTREMLLPSFTKKFGKTPYSEVSVGIENIFSMLRIDLFWRLSHLDAGTSPLGIRAKMVFNF